MDPKEYIRSLVTSEYLEVSGANVVGSGADATINPILHAYIKPILDASTVDELANACTKVQRGLMHLGPYSTVNLSLEPNKNAAGLQTLLAHLQLDAAKRFTLQTGTNVGNAEGYGYVKGTTRNYFGLGEVLTLDTHVGTRTKQSHLLTVSVPGIALKLPIDWKVEGLAYSSSKVADWGAHKQEVRGATFRCSHMLHSFGIDGVLRTLYSQNTKTLESPIFTQQAGHKFKVSAFLNYRRDTRDDMCLPSKGSLLSVASEIAAGDNPMAKASVNLQRGFKPHERLITSLSARFGYLHPLSQESSHLMDRFYMGGPLDLRGFTLNRAGPHEKSISIGGNCMASIGASVFTPLADKLYFHAFFNGGCIGNNQYQMSRVRASSGLGVVYNHPISRFELNIAMPLVAHQHDGLSKGLQLGVGMSYM